MSELSDLEGYLSEAKKAYHALQIGEQIATVSSPDGSATYNQSSRRQLKGYIADLKMQIDRIKGSMSRGPINFVHPY